MTRTSIISAIAVTSGAFSAPAIAQSLEYTNDPGGKVTAYGQLNPAYQSVDDGFGTTGTVVDNASSNSRIGVNFDQQLDSGSFRFNFETALGFRQSSGVSQESTPGGWQWEIGNLRKLEAIWTASYGKFYVGQGSMATDDVATITYPGQPLPTR